MYSIVIISKWKDPDASYWYCLYDVKVTSDDISFILKESEYYRDLHKDGDCEVLIRINK